MMFQLIMLLISVLFLCNIQQFDVYGNLLGLLSVHPQVPIVSIHHLDVVEPIFPRTNRVNAVKRLMIPANLDSASLVQQSICYDTTRQWTMSISWGYTVHVTRTYMPARMMEVPTRTFNDWHKRHDFTNVAFNTRPVTYTDCQRPRVFYLSRALNDSSSGTTISEYLRHNEWNPKCEWGIQDPSDINRIFVYKKPNPDRWSKVRTHSFLLLFNLLCMKIYSIVYKLYVNVNAYRHHGEIVVGYCLQRRRELW